MADHLRRIVVVLGRTPEIDVSHTALRAVGEAHGSLALVVVGAFTNPLQQRVIDELVDFSERWMEALMVYEIPPAAVRDDDEVLIAASGPERTALESVILGGRRAAC